MKKLFIVGTCDTKWAELQYARDVAVSAGVSALLVDVGTRDTEGSPDISAEVIAGHHPGGKAAVLGMDDRGKAVSAMAEALSRFLTGRDDLGGILGLGGSGNTALVTQAMRTLPIGLPKVMLSTVASGNTAQYMGPNDITMMYSVVDIAGLNAISRRVIANAANAAAGMVRNAAPASRADRPAIGMTMFGVTTECVTRVRQAFDATYDVAVFHATGTGGQSMEKLAESGFFQGVLDITTTEVADHLFGGVFPCTEDRFGAFIRTGLPYLGSVGAVDMINFGARSTVPAQHEHRNLYVHNAQVTLMRTTPDENARIGTFIVDRLNRMQGPVRFLLPLRGVSAIDAPGKPFHDPHANARLFAAIREGWIDAPNRQLIELDANINDPGFSEALVANFRAITEQGPQ